MLDIGGTGIVGIIIIDRSILGIGKLGFVGSIVGAGSMIVGVVHGKLIRAILACVRLDRFGRRVCTTHVIRCDSGLPQQVGRRSVATVVWLN